MSNGFQSTLDYRALPREKVLSLYDQAVNAHGNFLWSVMPSKDRFGETNRERLESNCVLCVIAMRKSGELVDESIRCRAVDIPPYRIASDHACKWEYWLP